MANKPEKKARTSETMLEVAKAIAKVMVPVIVAVIITAMFLGSGATSYIRSSWKTGTANATERMYDGMTKAYQIMYAHGWPKGSFTIQEVKPSDDKATPGQQAFSQQGTRDPGTMVAFLKSGTPPANALLTEIMGKTNSSKEVVLNPANWYAVQSLIPFVYPGNTGFNGMIVPVGAKDGQAGEIFMLFISPTTGSIVPVRGPCANPQTSMPVPLGSGLTPKDPSKDVGANRNVAPWKRDNTGGDPNNGHQISYGDGGTVSNGYQSNPVADAEAARIAAEAEADRLAAEAEAARQAAIDVDNNQDHTESGTPSW